MQDKIWPTPVVLMKIYFLFLRNFLFWKHDIYVKLYYYLTVKYGLVKERGFKSFSVLFILQMTVTEGIIYWYALIFGNKTSLHVIWYDKQSQELRDFSFLPLPLSKSRLFPFHIWLSYFNWFQLLYMPLIKYLTHCQPPTQESVFPWCLIRQECRR